MAKLYFYYGAMGSAKTMNVLVTAFNYEERGQRALIGKTGIDKRDGERIIKSRIGLERECFLLSEILQMPKEEIMKYNVLLIDEIQFASRGEIDSLAWIVDNCNVPVLCYGLRADFQSNLFEGSKRLMEIADEIHEIKTMCWCGRKATFNARYDENGIVRDGAQVMLGANNKYIALCRKHFIEGKLHK